MKSAKGIDKQLADGDHPVQHRNQKVGQEQAGRFDLEKLDYYKKLEYLDAFADALEIYLLPEEKKADRIKEIAEQGIRPISFEDWSSVREANHQQDRQSSELTYDKRPDVMRHVEWALNLDKGALDVRQFDNFLIALFREGYLLITPRTLTSIARKIETHFANRVHITVSAGRSQHRFARVACAEFLREIVDLGKRKRIRGGKEFNIGIVSGRTTKGVVDALRNKDWATEFGVDPQSLPENMIINVFALNVSYTSPPYFSSHANILAQNLADEIERMRGLGSARAYGLNAEVIVKKDRLKEVDTLPQTRDVLKCTQPSRARQENPDGATELDIVLTGAGPAGRPRIANVEGNEKDTTLQDRAHEEPPSLRGSIFYELISQARSLNLDFEHLEAKHVVGDLAYNALGSDGEFVPLLDKDGSEFFCYSAATIDVLDNMTQDKNKSVILVVQSTEENNKTPIIYACLGGRHSKSGGTVCHVSHVIIDEYTASDLKNYCSIR